MIFIGIALGLQVRIFLGSCVTGLILGLLYDIFKSFRYAFRSNRKYVFIQDILYFLISAFITFLFTLSVNHGDIRFYIIFGEIIGFGIYYLLFSKIFMKCSVFIIKTVKKVYMIIFKPFIIIFKKIYCSIHVFFVNRHFFSKKARINKKST